VLAEALENRIPFEFPWRGDFIETTTVFALLYAILFGATLNRLSPWSAFWKHTPDEGWQWVRWRLVASYTMFLLVPAVYFGLALHLMQRWQIQMPSTLLWTILWAILLFSSVLFLNACYRFWAFLVLRFKIAPIPTDDDGHLKRLASFGHGNYLASAAVPFIGSILGLFFLLAVFSCPR